MKKILPVIFPIVAVNAMAQNVGVGTTTPGSTLTVAGSVSAGYNSITNNYTLTASDYFVVYNGTSPATVTLPAALPDGSGNFKGRIYKIKNNTAYQLTIAAAGSEKINLDNSVAISRETTLELISTGLTSGSTWEAVSGFLPDGIRKALESAGCSSCAAYDAAGINNWVAITSGEYAALLSNVTGMFVYGAPSGTMASAATNGFGGATTITQNFTTETQLPPANFPVALSFKTGTSAPTGTAGMNFKLSNTGSSSGYANLTAATLPNVSAAAQTIYYFLLKRSTIQTPIGAASNMAIYQNATYQIGAIVSGGTNMFYGGGDVSNPNNSIAWTPLFQVLATATKQW